MFKEKESVKTKLTTAAEGSAPGCADENELGRAGKDGPEPAQKDDLGTPSKHAPQPAQNRKPGTHGELSEPVESGQPPGKRRNDRRRTQRPVPWWRAKLQFVILIALTAVAVPATILNAGLDGDAFLRSNQVDKAIAAYEKIIASDPKNALARDHLARLDMHLGKFDEAINLFSQVSALDPTVDHDLYNMRGLCYLMQDKNQQAANDFSRTTEPGEHPVAKVHALMAIGQKTAAERIVDSVMNKNEQPSLAVQYNLLKEVGRYEKAIKLCKEQFDDADKYNESAWRERLADIYFAQQKYNNALEEYGKASIEGGQEARLQAKMGAVAAKQGLYKIAINHYHDAIHLCKDQWQRELLYLRIQCLKAIAELERKQGNIAAADQATKSIPIQKESIHGQAQSYSSINDIERPEDGIPQFLFDSEEW